MMRFFTTDLRRNIIKIVCLTLGMAIGFLLIAKVYFEETFDTFHKDYERIYILAESVTMNGEYREYTQTPGAIAPGIKRYSPMVEHATRFTYATGDVPVKTDDGRYFRPDCIAMADSCFFDVFSTDIIAGDAHEALSVEGAVAIPKSIADQIGPDALGMQFEAPYYAPGYKFTVRAIYKDFPLNTMLPNAAYLSLSSIGSFMHDGRDNWMGNDRYTSFVKLMPGAEPEDLQPRVTDMLNDNIDKETMDITHFNILAKPISEQHTANDSVRTMIWILTLLAVVLLMSAGLNYLLITIGQMSKRSKEMAVRKCYGTSNLKIFGRVMGESLFFLAVSMMLAILVAMCMSDVCMRLLGNSVEQLLSTGRVWIVEGAVCVVLLIITGVIPAWLYCRTPVAHSFSGKVKTRKAWKQVLLSIQFFASGLLMCLLVLIGRQYMHISSSDVGFDSDRLGYLYLGGVSGEQALLLKNELERLGCVEGVTSNDNDLISYASGNNVWTTDVEKQVNVSDMYYANANLFDMTGIVIKEGATFRSDADSTVNEVMVEETFRDVWEKIDGPLAEDDGLVGKRFYISEHSGGETIEFTICGVFGKLKRGGVQSDRADTRAGVMFPTKDIRANVYVRFTEVNPENLAAAQEVVDHVVGEHEIYITPYRAKIEARMAGVRDFGLSVMVIGIVIVLIAMIGLVGYTSDEVQRRSREIAIRKVTGTSASKIVRLFVCDIIKIAIPSLIAGGAVAIAVGRKWVSQFTDQASVSPVADVICLLCLLAILISVVALNTTMVARSNPVEHLRSE